MGRGGIWGRGSKRENSVLKHSICLSVSKKDTLESALRSIWTCYTEPLTNALGSSNGERQSRVFAAWTMHRSALSECLVLLELLPSCCEVSGH